MSPTKKKPKIVTVVKKQKQHATSPKAELPDRAPDGSRGPCRIKGWWISKEDALDRSVGREAWWKAATAQAYKIHNPEETVFKNGCGNPSTPIWLYENGDMYLGNWGCRCSQFIECGFGILYNNFPEKRRGNIVSGQWKDGYPHGKCNLFWLESSTAWVSNRLPASDIKIDPNKVRSAGIPYNYLGNYKDGVKEDDGAVVAIKGGPTRRGPWKMGEPVGNWHDHESVAVAPAASPEPEETTSSAPVKQEDNNDAPDDVNYLGGGPFDPIEIHSDDVELLSAIKQEPVDDTGHPNSSPTAADSTTAHDQRGEENNTTNLRCALIRNFLAEEVFGGSGNLSNATLQKYSSCLFDQGFESVPLIKSHLTKEDVQTFDWMKPLHKRIISQCLDQGW